MQIKPSLIFSLMGLVAVGIPMATGADPHSSAIGSRLAILAPLFFLTVAIVLAIRELRSGRSTREWVRASIRLMFPIAIMIGIALLQR